MTLGGAGGLRCQGGASSPNSGVGRGVPDGPAGNTRRTVCGGPQVRYLAEGSSAAGRA